MAFALHVCDDKLTLCFVRCLFLIQFGRLDLYLCLCCYRWLPLYTTTLHVTFPISTIDVYQHSDLVAEEVDLEAVVPLPLLIDPCQSKCEASQNDHLVVSCRRLLFGFVSMFCSDYYWVPVGTF